MWEEGGGEEAGGGGGGDFDVRLVEWCVDARSRHVMHLSEREPALCLCTGHKNA